MSVAVLSIGSNLGDRFGHLRAAARLMRDWVIAVSPVYETAPWGPVRQGPYLNAVLIAADPGAGPRDWLSRAQAVEQAEHRVRERRWGPRTLDVDLIDIDGARHNDPQLTLPHPRAAQRAFVLVPWLAVDPRATLPSGPVAALVDQLPPAQLQSVQLRADLVLV
ncbi:MAG: 2-amino-4-hydroxy-6-hydroxymethyldihydropteridine diphosphokinase [Actinomycetia bacterium]|nr:2-amino-4-hydroxy-6-hydroxymethyldihydropteridine diphosphokinase [Actinomycetes bacterium]